MLQTRFKPWLFALFRALQIGIVSMGIVSVLILQLDSSVASQGVHSYQQRCAFPTVIKLRDDQGLERGHVAVWNDASNLYVKFFTMENWTFTATHVHITTPSDKVLVTNQSMNNVLVTNQSAFRLGHFDYTMDHSQVVSYAYTIPLARNDFTDLAITARGSVAWSDSKSEIAQTTAVWSGTAYGDNDRRHDFDYALQMCTNEKYNGASIPVASVVSPPGIWDNDTREEDVTDYIPLQAVSRNLGPVDDTLLGRGKTMVLNASTGALDYLRFANATTKGVNSTLASTRPQMMRTVTEALNEINNLVRGPEQSQTMREFPGSFYWTPLY